ncbi:MAG TPA: hypothetical protein VK973_03335 [Arenicellales bacterium]|nr:hypothetical protein [Arenicellales bacterium]
MLKHQIPLYKFWYMLSWDQRRMESMFERDPNNKPFIGRTYYDGNKGWVGICLNPNGIHDFPEMAAVLTHELSHVVAYVMGHCGWFPQDPDDMEPWCYLQEHLMTVSLKYMGYR